MCEGNEEKEIIPELDNVLSSIVVDTLGIQNPLLI